jgi:hypothetical protein
MADSVSHRIASYRIVFVEKKKRENKEKETRNFQTSNHLLRQTFRALVGVSGGDVFALRFIKL